VLGSLVIEFEGGSVRPRLEDAFGLDHNPSVVGKFKDPAVREIDRTDPGVYAAQTMNWRVVCFALAGELQVKVETVTGDLAADCDAVWKVLRERCSDLRPRLRSADLIDPIELHGVVRGSFGFPQHVAQRDVALAVAPALLTAAMDAVLVVGEVFSHDARVQVILGGIPTFVVALGAAAYAGYQAKAQKIVWVT
jgi:hypothetical protein